MFRQPPKSPRPAPLFPYTTLFRSRARLLVAADGRRSAQRESAGIRAVEIDYGQTAIVATVAHELPHEGVAHEHFLPSGPFALLPMTDAPADSGAPVHRSRSEERRVGKECVSTCRSRWAPYP